MTTILGIKISTFVVRVLSAIVYAAILLILFLYIPRLLLANVPYLGGGLSSTDYFYFALAIVAIGVIQSVFKGTYLGDAATIGNGIAEILYLLLITNDGILNFALPGGAGNVTLNFQTILFLFLIPPALSVVWAVVNAASRNSMKGLVRSEELSLR
jgi:hypothetical protein